MSVGPTQAEFLTCFGCAYYEHKGKHDRYCHHPAFLESFGVRQSIASYLPEHGDKAPCCKSFCPEIDEWNPDDALKQSLWIMEHNFVKR